jgi:DNA (cytosine-5)-methyltransferase 1
MVNGLSLFANVGIAETYLHEVGVNIVVANELLEERAKFYKHLYPACNMISGDIRDSDVFQQVYQASKMKDVQFIIATPPCQGMSIAGHMGADDERNYLIKYAIDMIALINPKFVLLENVVQQLTTAIECNGRKMLIPDYIKFRLGNDYVLNNERIINTADYGICQIRKRAIILLARKDLDVNWEFPPPDDKKILLKDILRDVPSLWPIIREKEYKYKLPHNTDKALSFHKWHQPPVHCWRNVECMLYTEAGNTAFDNPVHYPKRRDGKRITGFDTTYHRMYWEKPAPTVTRYNGSIGSQNNVHPGKFWRRDENGDKMYSDPRVLSIYELMKISSLPDDWNIPEWAKDELIRHVIGEGIPPLLIKKIVNGIKEKLS